MERTLVIGDIHGCYFTLHKLLSKVNWDSKYDTLVFLGDYIDRGKHAYEVVNFLMNLQERLGPEKIVCLCGNHEKMAINYFSKKDPDELWVYNGGYQTIASLAHNKADSHAIIEWFKSLPLSYRPKAGNYICCHAGLSSVYLRENSEDDLLWGRQWLLTDTTPREATVIFGHTPNPKFKAWKTKTGDIDIDCGCVYGGNLCCLEISSIGSLRVFYQEQDESDR